MVSSMFCDTFLSINPIHLSVMFIICPSDTYQEKKTFFATVVPKCPPTSGPSSYLGHYFASLASKLELELSVLV